jgi:hypothetical protein
MASERRWWAGMVALGIAGALACTAVAARADDETPEASAALLAEEFSDPLTTLPQVFVQDAYTPKSYGTRAAANRVIARLIVPRVPRFSLFPLAQLIRPSFSLVTVPTGRGSDTRATGRVTAQLLPDRRIDGVSPRGADRAADDGARRHDDRVSAAAPVALRLAQPFGCAHHGTGCVGPPSACRRSMTRSAQMANVSVTSPHGSVEPVSVFSPMRRSTAA